jgi:MFS family permease
VIPSDRLLLFLCAFLRATATGLVAVLLGIYLATRGFDPVTIGILVGCGLSGAALSTLIITYFGDHFGRRVTLLVLSLASALGGIALTWFDHPVAVGAVAFLGMVNGAGRDRGAALALEQAILPQTTTPQTRTRAFAWYNVLQDAGHALGGALAGLPTWLEHGWDVTPAAGYQVGFAVYASLLLATAALYFGLSRGIEAAHVVTSTRSMVSPASKRIVWQISGLFLIDSFAGGFLGTALLSYFFFERFGVDAATIALLFFCARAANALSHFGAAWLAKHLGLINTMVFTHIPSSLALIAVALAPTFPIAATLFLLRELLVEMDVPTRQSYIMAVVKPEERTWASGITSLVRMGGWAVAPFFAGIMMQGMTLAVPLVAGGVMKIGYDLLLWRAFRKVKPPEEQ